MKLRRTTVVWSYRLALLAMPLLVLWHRGDALYTPAWFTDPWYYLGYFRTLLDFKRDLFPAAYFGSRLSWILPGVAVHAIFPPLAANLVLHLTVHSCAVLALFATLRRTIGERAGFLTAMAFSVHPWLWAATGWDYVNGPVIAYFLVAMAAVTVAAGRDNARGHLALAGAAAGGAVYAHILWIFFLPVLILHYAGLRWLWRRAVWLRSTVRAVLWMATGFALISGALGLANFAVDGNLWFYSTSWKAALHSGEVFKTAPSPWDGSLPQPHLWFPLISAGAAIIVLPLRLRKKSFQECGAASLFAVELLAVWIWMAVLQARGIAALGFYHYAAYLLPFAFLAAGGVFWSGMESLTPRAFFVTCAASAAAFAVAWEFATPLAAVIPLAVMIAGRYRQFGAYVSLAGLVALTAIAHKETARLHGTRAQYERVMVERAAIERARVHGPIRFWFAANEPDAEEYSALNSLYLDTRLSTAFPQGGCDAAVVPGTLIVVPSARPDAAELARRTLADCWRAAAMSPVVVGGGPARLVLLRATTNLTGYRPLRVSGEALEMAEGDDAAPFPLDRWKKDGPAAEIAPAGGGGITIRTSSSDYEYAVSYPPLRAPVTGRYRFALRHSDLSGEFAFGAFPADNSRWVAVSTASYRVGGEREIAFSLDVDAGQQVILRIANNNNRHDGRPAAFRMVSLTARVAPRQHVP